MKPDFPRDGVVREFGKDNLRVLVFENRDLLGCSAARTAAVLMRRMIRAKGRVRMVFASAMSQTDFLKYIEREEGIEWGKVTAFHLDEYAGLPEGHPQSLGGFLVERLFDRTPGVDFHRIHSWAEDSAAECLRYASLLDEAPIDIMILGIGESGHLAFIDPPWCDFEDPEIFKLTDIDERSREQMVHDGCFERIEEVPRRAYTMTVPACLGGAFTMIIVPAKLKAPTIKAVLEGPLTTEAPASILRKKENAWLLLDRDSAALLSVRN